MVKKNFNSGGNSDQTVVGFEIKGGGQGSGDDLDNLQRGAQL